MEERAAHYGVTVDRNAGVWSAWSTSPRPASKPTRMSSTASSSGSTISRHAAFPQMAVGDGTSVQQCIDFVNGSGLGAIGTPDDAIAQIERLVKQSNGGFGAYLQLAHDWAAPAASSVTTSCLPPRRAALPGPASAHHRRQGARRAARPVLAASNLKAVEHSTAKYQAELEAKARSSHRSSRIHAARRGLPSGARRG